METSQLVFNKEGGNVTAAGYLIDSKMLQQGEPTAVLKGGAIASIFDSLKLGELAVPIGLFYLQDLAKQSSNAFNTSVFELYDTDEETSDVKLVEDTLYDKLLAMVNGKEEDVSKKNKITRKKRATATNKKTRVKARSTSSD